MLLLQGQYKILMVIIGIYRSSRNSRATAITSIGKKEKKGERA